METVLENSLTKQCILQHLDISYHELFENLLNWEIEKEFPFVFDVDEIKDIQIEVESILSLMNKRKEQVFVFVAGLDTYLKVMVVSGWARNAHKSGWARNTHNKVIVVVWWNRHKQ